MKKLQKDKDDRGAKAIAFRDLAPNTELDGNEPFFTNEIVDIIVDLVMQAQPKIESNDPTKPQMLHWYLLGGLMNRSALKLVAHFALLCGKVADGQNEGNATDYLKRRVAFAVIHRELGGGDLMDRVIAGIKDDLSKCQSRDV